MATIALNTVPQDVLERLSQLAQMYGSDVEAEAMKCLEKGLSEREQIEIELRELREMRSQSPNAWLTDELIRAARDEGRA